MFVRRLRSRDYDPGGAKRAPRRTAWRQAVSRVLDVAFVSDNVGVDSERNGTPSTVAGVPGSFCGAHGGLGGSAAVRSGPPPMPSGATARTGDGERAIAPARGSVTDQAGQDGRDHDAPR